VADRLSASPQKTQVVVICGNNVDLAERLRARTYPANVRVVVKGFQKNIDEFMAACDLLVTKAGPGTIAEAMVQGLPMVLSSFLPGQEAGNVPYVVDGGFGVYTGNNPRKIGDVVYRLFNEEPGRLQEMSERARAQSRAESSQLISKDIAAIALRKDQSLPTLKSSM
jgi:1,2-diacylglycerol 3-beta-galactosyltransferase